MALLWSLLVVTPKLSPSNDDDDSDEYRINIDLQYCNSHAPDQTLSFNLTFTKNDPQLIQFQDILEDLIIQWLEDLEGHHPHYPAIIDDLVSSCGLQLLQCSSNTADFKGIYLVEQRGNLPEGGNPRKIIKRLLVVTGMIIKSNVAIKDDYVPSCCTICLNDIDMHYDHGHDDDHNDDGVEFEMVKLWCTHVYHVDCIVEWILKCGIDVSCPMCRVPLFDISPVLFDGDKALVNGSSTLQFSPQAINQSSFFLIPCFLSQTIEYIVSLVRDIHSLICKPEIL